MIGFLHLGKQLKLSLAEISNFQSLDASIKDGSFISFNNSKFFDIDYNNLGGVRAAYKIICNTEDEFKDYLEGLDTSNNPVVYVDSNKLDYKVLKKICNVSDFKLKVGFKSSDFRPVRFANDKDQFYYVLSFENKLYFLKAFFIANASRYALRDYKKPYRDAKLGMLPPKLCQMMLNYVSDKSSIYDPFCGTGSLLMEATLMGCKNVYGSDLVDANVLGTEKNLFFISRKFQLDFESKVFQHDANKAFDLNFSPTAIVTEGFLGAPLHGNEPENFLRAQMHIVFDLYLKFFENISANLEAGSEVVMCFPIFKDIERDSEKSFYNLIGKLYDLGFEHEFLSRSENIKIAYYTRSDQHLKRLVFKLVKKD